MTTILRLRGLDVKAGTKDIRAFFKSLHIPEGGVYVIGGKLREAFIAFTCEKDAQSAMHFTGKLLKGSKVTLKISSMAELEYKLKVFLKRRSNPSIKQHMIVGVKLSPKASAPSSSERTHHAHNASLPTTNAKPEQNSANLPQTPHPDAPNLQAANSVDSGTAFLLGVYTVLQGLQSSNQGANSEAATGVDVPVADSRPGVSNVGRQPEQTMPGYVRLFGLPASATKETICNFFTGLTVQEVIVNVKLGLAHVCLVKFSDEQEAQEALHFNEHSLDGICVEVRGATEKMWTSALEECENTSKESATPKQSPLKETANHRQKPRSQLQIKKQFTNQLPFKIQKRPRRDCDPPILSPTLEYVVRVKNLPKTMTKTEIKELFGCPNIAQKYVQHLLDKEGNRTDTAFLIFHRPEDYDYAMNITGCHVGSGAIEVTPITRKIMTEIMAQSSPRSLKYSPNMGKKKKRVVREFDPVGPSDDTSSMNVGLATQTCLFVRNMHANVQKVQIQSFFSKYKLGKNDITLLRDRDGSSIGEAVVQFESEKLAALAQRLHGQDFMGTKVLLTLINVKQMEQILASHV